MKLTRAEESAGHVQTILDQFHRSNAENVRLRSEIASLRLRLRKTIQPSDDVFADVVASDVVTHPQTEQRCQNCGGSMVQMGRTASCTACEAMFAVNLDRSLGQRLSASVATSVDNRRDST